MGTPLEILRLISSLDSKNELILRIDAERAGTELKKLYELNEVLLQKCHVLEKMVSYKVDHLFDTREFVELTPEEVAQHEKV